MIKKCSLSILVFLAIINAGFAQKYKSKKIFHLEAKSVRFTGDGIAGESYFFKPSIEAGLGIQYPLTSRVSFNPELTFSQRGFHGKTINSDSAYVERNISLNYLDISPNFEIKLGSVSEFSSGFSIWGGPYLGIGLWDNTTYDTRSLNPTTKTYVLTSTSGESFSRDLRRLDMGVKVGIGIVSQNFVSIGITYQTGLLNISTKPGALQNQSLGFYLKVFFDDVF